MDSINDTEKKKFSKMQILALFSFGMLFSGMFFSIITIVLSWLNLTITNVVLWIVLIICIVPAVIFVILKEIESRYDVIIKKKVNSN